MSDDALVNGSYKPRLKKYDKENEKWSQVATPLDIKVDSKIKMGLVVTPDGIPLIMYRNLQNQPTLTMYDVFTGQWTDEIRLDSSSTEDVHIDYHAASKKGYIGFNNSFGEFILYEFVK